MNRIPQDPAERKAQIEARFWTYVVKTDGCWIFTGGRDPDGYGIFYDGKRCRRAHRYSFETAFGWILPGIAVLHKCDNPSCVRPLHLFLGTNRDNMVDRNRKGRTAAGIRHTSSKLTENAVRDIREWYAQGRYTVQEMADMLNVHNHTIQQVIYRKTWRHVT